HQPDAGADRALDQSEEVREEGLYAPQAPRREGREAPSRQDRRQADQDVGQAGDLYRRAGRGTVQAGALSVLRRLAGDRVARVRLSPASPAASDARDGARPAGTRARAESSAEGAGA